MRISDCGLMRDELFSIRIPRSEIRNRYARLQRAVLTCFALRLGVCGTPFSLTLSGASGRVLLSNVCGNRVFFLSCGSFRMFEFAAACGAASEKEDSSTWQTVKAQATPAWWRSW